MERIESKGDSAAAVICRLFREIPLQRQLNNMIENTLGVVALLATVQTNELSRLFLPFKPLFDLGAHFVHSQLDYDRPRIILYAVYWQSI